MSDYTETMFDLEQRVARAEAEGDEEERDERARMLAAMGEVPCSVCGTMIRFHHLDGWIHAEQGMDHDGRPDRVGFQWPAGLPLPGGHAGD